MERHRNISHIRWLMISSQILLTLFLGYWLYTQYEENRKLLTRDLERGLRQSEQQVMDTMLATQLIDPILSDTSFSKVFMFRPKGMDSLTFSSSYTYNHDTVSRIFMQLGDAGNESVKLTGLPETQSQIKIIIDDSIPDRYDTTYLNMAFQDTSNKLLLKSVRLLINSVEKINTGEQSLSTYFIAKVDTTLLTSLFNQFLIKEYSGFTVLWHANDSISVNNHQFPGMVVKSELFENKYLATIRHYHVYLLKAIIPQLTFAIILLLITTLAFRMAYINLKNQRKLIALKNDFISNITHELKTPVSTVKVALEALLDFDMKKDPTRTKEYLEMAHSEINRLDLLVNQVLNNSALEEGRPFITIERVNLTNLIKEVLFSMQTRFDQANAEVRLEANEEEILINADKFHVHGVLVNLIDNSLKYCTKKPEISIQIQHENRETLVVLEDNGMGIPDEYLDKVFEKFFRVPTANLHNAKGYGLGLNYAALVMQQHQGRIGVKNLDRGGCQFTLIFPAIKQ
ncbi:MAG: hypothetical protein A2W85_13635 [Bacteroidetes bacterium GWF2_41_31]|nr:MAG: hypothetical protein A2W85_13635 [Bacteroidetes bacterium GWF2_41_31]OFZ09596.1 MAG: hypothetical protein A2338_10340 [Bacteroidetes bacterium RIFOXYB12_FULL_41_6]